MLLAYDILVTARRTNENNDKDPHTVDVSDLDSELFDAIGDMTSHFNPAGANT